MSKSKTGEPFNLARFCIAENARRTPDKTALIVADGSGGGDLRLSFGEVERSVLALAGGFASLGLARGSRVLIRIGNEPDTIIVFFAAVAAGLVAIPTSMMLTPKDVAFVAKDSGAALVVLGREATGEGPFEDVEIADPDRLSKLKRATPLSDYADTNAEDPAYLVYTSGTTGSPKGVVHAHRVILGRRPMHEAWLGLCSGDVVLHAGAFNWTYTIGVGALDPWACGATGALARNVEEPSVWLQLVERLSVTIFAAVPGVYRQILKRGQVEEARLPSLRHGVAAGEALQPALLDEWRARTGLEIYESFGMSELSTFISSAPSVLTRPGSPGKPQPGRRIAALPQDGGEEPLPQGETGLLAVHRSDPGLMLGYWERPDEEKAAFRGDWFVSGDLVSIDEDGYVWHRGRADDVMNALGYRVSPAEVEAALADHPAIADVGVTEWRAREDLSVIAAFVVLREGDEADEASFKAQAEERLAAYKRPKVYHFVERLPRSANGKLLRRKLVETLEPR